jgi:catechol 2,3-dioxygenase-like lactoylglutathione lyase family enzyme
MTFGQGGTPVSFVYVRDRERALGFYRDLLGLPIHSSDPYGDFIAIEGALLRLTVMPDHQPTGHPSLGWAVADVRAAVTALRERGVAFAIYDGMGQDADGIWTAPDGSDELAWFADPDGNVLMLSRA